MGEMAQYGCSLAPPLPAGLVFTDTRDRGWVLGGKLGAGAFGAIYTAAREGEKGPAEYVVKVEPHDNGPLFVEMHAFLRFGEEKHMADWRPRFAAKPHGWVGIPRFHGTGSFMSPDESSPAKQRFVVMTRFGADLEKFFQSGSKPFPLATVLNISVQVLNSLEYIHSKGYCHNDIKAQNLLLDSTGCDVFLVDFGLACKFQDNYGFHSEGGPDERRAHDGTREYTSRDAHTGAHSRRGDLETLAYNMVHWTTGFLPWANSTDLEYTEAQKIGFLENIPAFLEKCFKPSPYPEVLEKFLETVVALEFKSKPDYRSIRKLFTSSLVELGSEPHEKLQFNSKKKQRRSRKSDIFPPGIQVPLMEDNMERSTRSKDTSSTVFWQDVVDPESIIKSSSRSHIETEQEEDPRKEAATAERAREALANPTPEMARLLSIREEREREREKLSWRDQLNELNKRKEANKAKFAMMDLTPSYNTPIMEEIILRRAERLARDHTTPEPSDEEMEYEKDDPQVASKLEDECFSPTSVISPIANLSLDKGRTVSFCSPMNTTKIVTPRRTRSNGVSPISDYSSPPNDLVTDINSPVNDDTPTRKSPISGKSKTKKVSVRSGSPPRQMGDKTPGELLGKSPKEVYETCIECSKTLNTKSMARHMKTVHSSKRSLPATTTHTGQTPELKRGKRNVREPLFLPSEEPVCHTPPRKTSSQPGDPELSDSPSKNLRMAECPICGLEVAKSLLSKHFDDQHSPSGTRRSNRRKEKMDDMTGRLAKVSVSQDSPAKIRNFDSPSQQRVAEETVGRLGHTFKRGLVL